MRLYVIPPLGTRPLQQITANDIDALNMSLERRLAPGTVRLVHGVLGTCLGAVVRKGLLVANPVSKADIPPPGEKDAGQVLDQEQLTALVSAFRGTTLYPLVAMATFMGARRNELLAFRWSDVDFATKTVTIARAFEWTKAHDQR